MLVRPVYPTILLAGALIGSVRAQSVPVAGRVHSVVEVGGLSASPAQTPFWLRSNQYGTVPQRGSFGTLHVGIQRDYRSPTDSARAGRKHRFDWGFGLYAVGNAGPPATSYNPSVVLPDAHVKLKFGRFELYGGNRREVIGLGDTLLTSGFMAWSGNALPFPKIQLHTPDYVPLGFIKNLLAFRVGYAHGWLVNTYIQRSYLHQKYLYGRFGKPHWKLKFYGGLNHQVQWGGRADYLLKSPFAVNGQLPASLQDYVWLVTGRYPDAIQGVNYTDFDGENRVGNHLGSYDFALEWNGRDRNWLLYHQHYYEDASGLALQNLPDGLTGLRLLNRRPTGARFRFRRVVLEWLTTTNQSGPTFDLKARYQGADNYFNHSQYVEGWSYRGRTIGTPFLIPSPDIAPALNPYARNYFPDNRVVMYYVGATGAFRRGPVLTARLSYSRNFGTYNYPYPGAIHQLSALLTTQVPITRWPGTVLTASVALDQGALLVPTAGGFVSMRKSW